MTRLKHAAIERTARDAIGHLSFVESFAAKIADRANNDRDDGIKARSYDGDGRGGSDLTAPERAAAPYLDVKRGRHKQADTVEVQTREFLRLLDLARDTAFKLRQQAGKLLPQWDDARDAASLAARANQPGGQGHCANCNWWCPGTREDRLRGPRCSPCYTYWLRHDRSAERPRELWGAITVDQLVEQAPGEAPRCVSTYWHQGTTIQCIRPQDHDGEHRAVNEGRTVPWSDGVAKAG